jgi:hypothetical protein
MASRDEQLTGEVEERLRGREHWSVQPSSSPGLPAQWCLLSGPEIELSVTVDRGAVVVYVMDADAEVILEDGRALTAWLDANEELFLARHTMATELFDELLSGLLDEWGSRT